MGNKSLLLKLGLVAIAVGGFSLSFSSAATFRLDFDSEKIKADSMLSITDNMMYVHFADNENNFGGFLYFSNGTGSDEADPVYEVKTSNSEYLCSEWIQGFYYNSERGERLWPLDTETWSGVLASKGLTTSGGIYASCFKDGYEKELEKCPDKTDEGYRECVDLAKSDYKADGFGFYGSVSQSYSGRDFNLTIGVNYDTTPSQFIRILSGSELVPSFVRLQNLYPVGFVYDYNGGVGLAGCKFLRPEKDSMKNLVGEYKRGGLSTIFTYDAGSGTVKYQGTGGENYIDCEPISLADTLLRVIIEGIVGMNEGGSGGNTKFGSLGNVTDTKMQYFGTKSVESSTLVNYAVKKAELLCRGKWQDAQNLNIANQEILCLEASGNGNITGDLNQLNGKTLIVKNGNVTIKPFTKNDIDKRYDIYLLNGNLFIDENGVVNDVSRLVFTTGGFISTTTKVEDFSGNVKAALCPGGECNGRYSGGDAVVGVYIRGNFIVNGKVRGAGDGKLNNKYFIYGKFTSKDDFNTLQSTFSWTCENGVGKDGNYCPRAREDWYNPYRNAALVVIDQNYGSPLLR